MQREQIEGWIAMKGETLGKVFEEPNQSGGRADRPRLQEAIERVERGESGGLVVFRLHRFARSVIDGLTLIARIQKAGGTFVSVQDGFDLKTTTGKLVMRVLLAVAEWEFEQSRDNWDIARSRAIARGVYVSTKPPLGYRRGKDGRLRPKPEAVPVIAEAFRMRGAAATLQEVADFMNEAGMRSFFGHPMTAARVQALLRNRAYLGEARSGEFANPAAHQPMIDKPSWQLAQRAARPRKSINLPLVGLVRCASCGRRMEARNSESKGSVSGSYYCHGPRAKGGCPGPGAARAEEIEPLVEELVFALARRGQPAATERQVADREQALRTAERGLATYRDSAELQRTLGMSSFEAGLAERQSQLEDALLGLAMARRAAEPPGFDIYELEAQWGSFERGRRRAVVEEFLDGIFIERGREPILQRAWVCRRGRGPLERNDNPGPCSFDPTLAGAQRLHAPRRWSERRIEAGLREFLGARSEWPDYPRFERAGYGRLQAQVMAWGGPFYWARRLGLQIERDSVRWSAVRVRGALKPLLRGQTKWPRPAEFERAGLAVLRAAVATHGGVTHWAEEFGLEPPRVNGVRKWNKERVERELREFTAGRERFPIKVEFGAAGRGLLYDAVRQHGGIDYWAVRLSLRPAEPRRKRKSRRRC